MGSSSDAPETIQFVHSGYAYEVETTSRRAARRRQRLATLKENKEFENLHGIESRPAYRFIKRAFDIVFSILILVAFCWLFAIVAIAIKIDDPKGPVIFKQRRVTKDGKRFTLYKFRSMCADAEDKLDSLKELNEKTGPVFKIENDPRITRVGKWLRKLSIDEMPQFVNVLKGEMSVVGPRPALPSEVKTYTRYQRQRLLIQSGLTCYWQTRRNRDSITFEEWIDLDLLYVKQCSVWADFKLIVQTIGVVLTAQGS
ncbi:MAG: sugar transferase [Eggerthellaceae bacterium]|nr:sugar transferase [Eggerthellaceae bacterium]